MKTVMRWAIVTVVMAASLVALLWLEHATNVRTGAAFDWELRAEALEVLLLVPLMMMGVLIAARGHRAWLALPLVVIVGGPWILAAAGTLDVWDAAFSSGTWVWSDPTAVSFAWADALHLALLLMPGAVMAVLGGVPDRTPEVSGVGLTATATAAIGAVAFLSNAFSGAGVAAAPAWFAAAGLFAFGVLFGCPRGWWLVHATLLTLYPTAVTAVLAGLGQAVIRIEVFALLGGAGLVLGRHAEPLARRIALKAAASQLPSR